MSNEALARLVKVSFGIIYIASSASFVSVLYEYRSISFCDSSLGWFLARLYGSLFVYPATFGLLALGALYAPAVTVLNYLKNDRRLLRILVVFAIAMPGLAIVIELQDSPVAPFEFSPSSLESAIGSDYLAGREAAFCPDTNQPAASGASTASTIEAQTQSLLDQGHSVTSILYMVSFVAGAFIHIFIFLALAVFLRIGRTDLKKYTVVFKKSNPILMGTAIFLGSIWCIFRLTFRMEEHLIYGYARPLIGDYAIVALYVILLLVFALQYWVDVRELSQKISLVTQILALVAGAIAFNFSGLNPVLIFGSKSSISNLSIVILLLFFISFFWFVVTSPDERPRARRRPARR